MNEPDENAVEVPWREIASDTLRRLAEEFVTRDGTDYGAVEQSVEAKVANLMRELERGDAVIVYETTSETINIVTRRTLESRRR